jgi:selenocysteine lyase/cysteine desulfurase
VHSSTGVKLPVREIARVVARKNASRDAHDRILFCLDGVHGFGVEAATPDELGVDFLVSGCHKWLFGPRGTGVVWGRRDAWAEVSPTIPSFDNAAYGAWIRGVTPSGPAGPLQTPGGFHTMEHRWALKEAFAWRTQLGAARVEARTHALARRLKDGLDGVALVTPRSQALSAGLVMASLPRDPDETVRLLYERHRIVASVTPYRERYVRLGPSIVNDEHEVDVAARALRELA